jgi:hypothetical protein
VMLEFLLTMQKYRNRNSRNPEIETPGVTISEIQDVHVQTDQQTPPLAFQSFTLMTKTSPVQTVQAAIPTNNNFFITYPNSVRPNALVRL